MEEWQAYKDELDPFCSASGMCISLEKSSFLYNNLKEDVINNICAILIYKMEPIEKGFKYLGYWLKPLSYGLNDWRWIIQNFERRLSNWSYIYLFMDNRLILIRSVLCGIPVYWFSLERIPKSTLRRL